MKNEELFEEVDDDNYVLSGVDLTLLSDYLRQIVAIKGYIPDNALHIIVTKSNLEIVEYIQALETVKKFENSWRPINKWYESLFECEPTEKSMEIIEKSKKESL